MTSIDHGDAGEVCGAQPLLQRQRMRRRQRCNVALDPERNEMLVGAQQIFGDDPRIRRLIDANETERDVGSPGQGLQQRDPQVW